MNQNILFKIDKKDIRLIGELERDSRNSVTKMAKSIGVSKEVANYRLKRLIDARFVKGFRLIADYSTMNFQIYRLLLNLYNIHETTKSDIIDYVKKSHFASFNALLQSVWDIEIIIRIRSISEFHEFYDDFMENFSEHIYEKDLSVITRTHFLGHPYIHGIFNPIVVGQQKPVEINELDEKIISILSKNPRTDTVEMSKKTGITPSAVQYRMKSLVSHGVIKAIRPVINGPMIGYTKYKVEITLSKPAHRKEVIQFLKMKPNATKIIEFIGKSDFEFHADFQTPMDIEKFMTELRTKFHVIKDYEIIPILKEEMH